VTTGNPSFRDPDGQLLLTRTRAIRLVRDRAVPPLERFLASPLYASLVERGDVLPAAKLGVDPADFAGSMAPSSYESTFAAAYEQPRLPFISYASEWPAPMLHSAAELTLRVLRASLEQGWGLKDATPSNIGFRGSSPVFLDILSFEERDPGDPIWLPYGQFVRTFLLPLMLLSDRKWSSGIRPEMDIDGVDPEQLSHAMSFAEKLTYPARSLVTIPAMLSRGSRGMEAVQRRMEPERAHFVLRRMIRSLENALGKSGRGAESSRWTTYVDDVHDRVYHEAKRQVVAAVIESNRPSRLLDIGCNTGSLSLIAAERGCSVVAIDSDAPAAAEVYRRARAGNLDILPLVVDIANPTPGRGWRNGEQAPFLERATGGFDMVLAAAVMHHLMLRKGIPVAAIVELLADLSTNIVMLEFIPASDPMFLRMAAGREAITATHTRERFIAACERRFEVIEQHPVGGSGREMFVLKIRAT
jgi:SAM-dependent methyltransferase